MRKRFHATSERWQKKRDFSLRVMQLSCWITFCGAVSCSYAAALLPRSLEDTAAITAFIHKHARKERGEENFDARKMMTGDLDGDEKPETVVLYTIEGQNQSINYIQYLSVFAHRNGHFMPLTHTLAGGKDMRSVKLMLIDQKRIRLNTLMYGPKDASCCPSVKGTTSYMLLGKTLREQKKTAD